MAEDASKKQGKLMNPEEIYQLDKDDHTYATLNERPGTYDGSPGAARLDLGRSDQELPEVEIIEDNDDDGSNVSNLTGITDYSKRDLYKKLKEMEINISTKQKSSITGSAPQGNSKPQQNTPEGEESLSYNDSSSLSSTSSEEEDSGAAVAPSG